MLKSHILTPGHTLFVSMSFLFLSDPGSLDFPPGQQNSNERVLVIKELQKHTRILEEYQNIIIPTYCVKTL